MDGRDIVGETGLYVDGTRTHAAWRIWCVSHSG